MIKCYSWPTPNGIKIHIMLEECSLNYKVYGIDITKGDQFKKSFLKISPNNKMPAIVDEEGPNKKPISIFESGAILMYLAEKTGKFLPKLKREKYKVVQWLMFQMGGVGPMLGQSNFFHHYCPEKIPYAINRYKNEVGRIYNVLDKQLKGNKYLTGNNYTIADIAVWPWIIPYYQGQKIENFRNLYSWYKIINERTAVKKGLKVLSKRQKPGKEIKMNKAAKERLYGNIQRDAGKMKVY